MTYEMYHYYDREIGPFRNLSSLPPEEAQRVTDEIKRRGETFAGKRADDYLAVRRRLETAAREQFVAKGGRPKSSFPHYMTLGHCEWLLSWYKHPAFVRIDWHACPEEAVSFTYGDLFPTMRVDDGKPYRKQVYTKREIVSVVERYGMPQDRNRDGSLGPERYIEVQVWDEDVIKHLLS